MFEFGRNGTEIGFDRIQIEQDRIGQDRIEQNRIGQDRIGQDRIGQNRLDQTRLLPYRTISWFQSRTFSLLPKSIESNRPSNKTLVCGPTRERLCTQTGGRVMEESKENNKEKGKKWIGIDIVTLTYKREKRITISTTKKRIKNNRYTLYSMMQIAFFLIDILCTFCSQLSMVVCNPHTLNST